MTGIIERDRSIIPACDVDMATFRRILEGTADVDGVGGYKIGPALTGRPGYDAIVKLAREFTKKPLIFDAQKWGTDIPDTAKKLLEPVRDSGINAVILFPQSGPITEYEWISAAQSLGLGVIVGGEMTHLGYREGDEITPKGGYRLCRYIQKRIGNAFTYWIYKKICSRSDVWSGWKNGCDELCRSR